MSENIIKSVEEKIKNCEETKLVAESRIVSLRKQIEEAERDLFRANNVKACLEGALKNLIEAWDRDADIAAIRPVKDEEMPADYLGPLKPAEEKIGETGEKMEEAEPGEPLTGEKSAMEKIGDDIEEEMKEDERTDEQKTKDALADADRLIEKEKLRQEQAKKGWPLCTVCNSNRTSPVNKKGICTECQLERKTDRPYKRRKKP